MDPYESLSHTKWACKYHVVFIPKCRRRTLSAFNDSVLERTFAFLPVTLDHSLVRLISPFVGAGWQRTCWRRKDSAINTWLFERQNLASARQSDANVLYSVFYNSYVRKMLIY
jgi:hypothetical protein